MDHVSFQLPGTWLLPKWYTVITKLVHCHYQTGTSSLPKTGTLLVADYTAWAAPRCAQTGLQQRTWLQGKKVS